MLENLYSLNVKLFEKQFEIFVIHNFYSINLLDLR